MKTTRKSKWLVASMAVLLSALLTLGVVSSLAGSADNTDSVTSGLSGTDNGETVDGETPALGASSYKVSIDSAPDEGKDDAYFAELSEKAEKEITSFFTVTYEKDGQTVKINDGDMLPHGTVITAEVNTMSGGGYMAINDGTVEIPFRYKQLVSVSHTFNLEQDTSVRKTFAEIMPIAAHPSDHTNTRNGAGTLVRTHTASGSLDTLFGETKEVYRYTHTVNSYYYTSSSPSGHYHNSGSPSSSTYFANAGYDAFEITLSGNTVTVNSSILAGRRIKIKGDGTVNFANSSGSGNFTFSNYTQGGLSNITQAIIIEGTVKVNGTFNGTGNIIFNTGANNATHPFIEVNGSVNVSGTAQNITTNGNLRFISTSNVDAVLSGQIQTWTATSSTRSTCSTGGSHSCSYPTGTLTYATQSVSTAAAFNGTYNKLPNNVSLTSLTGDILLQSYSSGGNTIQKLVANNGTNGNVNINSCAVTLNAASGHINARLLETNNGSSLNVPAGAFVNVWQRSTYRGAIAIAKQFGPTDVESTATGTVGTLTARGSANLKSGSVTYTSVFGGTTSDTTTPTTINDNYTALRVTPVLMTVNAGVFNTDFYGGGNNATVSTTVTTNITGGTFNTNIYGGGKSVASNINTGAVTLDITSGSFSLAAGKNIYGGSHASGTGTTTTTSTAVTAGAITVPGSVYAGDHAQAANTTINGTSSYTQTGGTIQGSLYGGSHSPTASCTSNVVGLATASTTGRVNGSIYGGGHAAAATSSVGATSVSSSGGVGGSLYGGGHAVLADAKVNGNITIAHGGGVITDNLYGGGNALSAKAEVTGNIDISSTGNINGSFYGGGISTGGNSAKVDGYVSINRTAGTIAGDFYAGGTGDTNGDAAIGKHVSATVSGTVAGDVYGGGQDNPIINSSTNNPAVYLELSNATVATGASKDVYGGSRNAQVTGNIEIKQSGGGSIGGNLYGAGNAVATSALTTGDVKITTTGTVTKNLYGGGISASGLNADVNGKVNINQTSGNIGGDVFGGGTGDHSHIGQYTELELSGTVGGHVYGGGDINPINNTTTHPFATSVKINGQVGTSGKNVYGGGKFDIVTGNTKVETTPGSHVSGNVYGGGIGTGSNDADIAGYTNVIVAGNVLGTVFGGGVDGSDIRDYTNVTVNSRGTDKVHGHVYGGGADAISKILSQDSLQNSTTVTINGNVVQNIYGGSNQSEIPHNTLVTLQSAAYDDYTVGGNLYGGSHTNLTHINGFTRVHLNGGTIDGFVFGGGTNGCEIKNNTPNDTFATIVNIAGGRVRQTVYGGGEYVAPNASNVVRGSTKVDMTSGHVMGNIYGGGLDSEVANYAEVYVGNTTNTGECIVDQDVYGGGYGPGGNILDTVKGTLVVIRETGVVNSRVFGGGHDLGNIVGSEGTTVHIYGTVGQDVFGGGNKADLTPTTVQGTNVTVFASGKVGRDVFGGGLDAIVDSQQTTDVLIRGHVGQDVYGGGHAADASGTYISDITQVRGPFVKVTGDDAFVGNNVYGGGYGETASATAQYADVAVSAGANVVHSVFGGGRGADGDAIGDFGRVFNDTNVAISGANTVIGNKAVVTDILVTNNYLIGCTTFYDRGEIKDGDGFIPNTPGCLVNRWTNVGNVYGGGSWAVIGGDTKVTISGLKQKSFNRISGGNKGLRSLNPERNIHLFNLGEGVCAPKTSDEERADLSFYYADLQYYSAIRFLQDYKVTNAHKSYLTVYYNLKSTDDARSTHGLHNEHDSELNMFAGVYHSWRPQDHTVVRIEPRINIHDYGKFRMEAGYTVTLDNGIYTTNAVDRPNYLVDRIRLLIDAPIVNGVRSEDNSGTTTKVYGPDNVVMDQNIFAYQELPRTTVPSDLRDQNSHAVTGVNVYIPPMNIKNDGIEPTSPGGSTGSDSGSGRGGSSGGGGGGSRTYSGGGAGNPSVSVSGYSTDATKTMDHGTAIKSAGTAAKQKTSSNNAVVVESKAGKVTAATLIAMQKEAQKYGKNAILHGDTVYGNKVEGRIYIDASKATNLKNDIALGVFTGYEKTARTSKIFSTYFKNKVAIISLAQQGEYGMDVKIAAKVDLKGLDTKNLIFYSYDVKTNNYSRIATPKYSVDTNGYIHFTTNVGGEIIITDKALERK